jgi:hypothetical protein
MRPFPRLLLGCALLLLFAGAVPCRAAWCNVFQVCCNSCGGTPSASFAAPDPCCNPCPPVCMKYVQKSYYQPVTCYQTRTYYEPCTTYRTSYYWEQCTSYRYSCYYDPCTCSYQQVACPVTSYRLRSQCCPVTSYLQRCCLVPVTSYQEVRYYEAVPDCPQPCPNPCPNGTSAAPPVAAPSQPGLGQPMPGTGQPPIRVQEEPPMTGTYKPGTSFNRQLPPIGVGPGPSPRLQPQPQAPVPAARPAPPPTVRLDKIVVGPAQGVEGQVLRSGKMPHGGAQVLFVSAERQGVQHAVTADESGRFSADLSSGTWLVYLKEAGNQTHFQSKVEVRNEQVARVTLTSR